MASQMSNLITNLFGTFTKTIVNGRAVWSAICSPNDTGLACYPKGSEEGFICYILRILDAIGVFSPSVWNIGNGYCKNTLVASGFSLYVSIQQVPAGIAIGNTSYWTLLLTAPTGPQGIQGPAGASGGGSAISWAERIVSVNDSLLNTDALIVCEGGGGITLTLSAMAGYDGGKWFIVKNSTTGSVTISATTQTFEGAANYVLTMPGESAHFAARNNTDWKLV